MSLTQASDENSLYNPGNLPGDDVWEPEPNTIAELYKKIEKVCYRVCTKYLFHIDPYHRFHYIYKPT